MELIKINLFSDESRITQQRKLITAYIHDNPRIMEYSPKELLNTEKVGGVYYVINDTYKLKIPEMMSAARRKKILDQLTN